MNPLENIRVVLVGTLYTGNVGSSCRAMANMGIHHLRLAAPNLQNSWEEGERLAVHATDILNGREEFATFEEAVADCVAVVGTTAREGLYRQHVRAPRDCAADILALAGTGLGERENVGGAIARRLDVLAVEPFAGGRADDGNAVGDRLLERRELLAVREDVRRMHGKPLALVPGILQIGGREDEVVDAHVGHRPAGRTDVAGIEGPDQDHADVV